MSLDAARLGTDIDVPVDPAARLPVDGTGDLVWLVGMDCLRRDVQRRMVTEPGAMLYRPTYGAGLLQSLGAPASPAEKGRMATRARVNLLADSRILDAVVSIGALSDRVDGARITTTITLRDDTTSNVEVA